MSPTGPALDSPPPLADSPEIVFTSFQGLHLSRGGVHVRVHSCVLARVMGGTQRFKGVEAWLKPRTAAAAAVFEASVASVAFSVILFFALGLQEL